MQTFTINADHLHKLVGMPGVHDTMWRKLFAAGANPNARDERASFLLHKASFLQLLPPCSGQCICYPRLIICIRRSEVLQGLQDTAGKECALDP